MIKHLIFDIGNVLVGFEWRELLERNYPARTAQVLANAVFGSPVWPRLDVGDLTDEEEVQLFVELAPAYEKEIREVCTRMGDCLRLYDTTLPWLKELKAKGYQLYALSNWPRQMYEQRGENLSFLKELDGYLLSYRINKVKPNADIYELLLKTYAIRPEEAVFLDDTLANVEAARALGIHGIHFQNQEQAIEELRALGVET